MKRQIYQVHDVFKKLVIYFTQSSNLEHLRFSVSFSCSIFRFSNRLQFVILDVSGVFKLTNFWKAIHFRPLDKLREKNILWIKKLNILKILPHPWCTELTPLETLKVALKWMVFMLSCALVTFFRHTSAHVIITIPLRVLKRLCCDLQRIRTI